MKQISDRDHKIACDWIRSHIGLNLDADKKYLIETRLEPVAFRYGFESLGELLQTLGSDEPIEHDLQADIFSSITTHETSFFRDHHPFNLLKNKFIPEFIKRTPRGRELSVWSSACSNGQEIFSVAMLVLEHFHELSGRLNLHATDICLNALEKASLGAYTQSEVSRGLHATLLIKYFEQDPGGAWIIKAAIRDMVSFEFHNLIESWDHIGHYDVIFLRNVLIYFDIELKRKILGMIKQHLNPGGILLLGGSESTNNIDEEWNIRSEGGCVYYSLD